MVNPKDKFDLFISIHTPARGATHRFILYPVYKRISIHAPRVGSDRK